MIKFIKISLLTVFIVTVTVFILNLFFSNIDKRNMDDTDKFKSVPNHINLCNFGSSHGLYGFSYDLVDKEKYITFNFGLSSQCLSYDYRLLQEYISHFEKKATIFIPISYFSLIGDLEEKQIDFLEKNKRYYKILSPNLIKEYDYYTDFFITRFPSLIRYEHLASDLLKWLLNKNKYNDNLDGWRYGMDDKFDLHADVERAASRHIVENKLLSDGAVKINQYEINQLYKMIEFCKLYELKPILLTTPFLNEYLMEIDKLSPNYRKEFKEKILLISKDLSIPYYDYSNDVRFIKQYDYFMNGDHLSELGAKEFVKILVEEIIE